VRSTNETMGKRIVGRGTLMLGIAGLLAWGCARPANQATRAGGSKGQFGAGQATLDYLDKLDFVISGRGDSLLVADYPCKVASACLPNGSVRLMFIPEATAYKVDWGKAMKKDAEGDVVAAVVNVDGIDFPDLNLAPGERAYAWVGQVGPDPDKDRGFAVYKLDQYGKVEGNPWWLTLKDKIQHCDNGQARDKPAIHETHKPGETCKTITASSGFGGGASLAYAAVPAAMALAPGGGSLWISCSGGCCEVGALQ
jgi:hypothetical protein